MTASAAGPWTHEKLAGSPAVLRWLQATGYGSAPAAERAEALDLLAALCSFAGAGPEDLVAGCLRTTKAGERTISAKGRREAEATIERFVESRGLTGHAAIVTSNRLRGFLIHNGIFLQGRASTC